jgi:hypothetical protein
MVIPCMNYGFCAATELCRVKKKARRVSMCCGVPMSIRFHYWRNYLVFVSMTLEFVQYMSIALRFSN